MGQLVFGHDQAVADWVARQQYGRPFHPPYTAIGVLSNDRLSGGLVFTGFNGDSVELSLAGHVAERGIFRAVLSYVFEQMGCKRLQVHTSFGNKKVRKQLPRLGFTFEGRARRFYGHHDGLVYSLTVDDLPAFREKWKL